MPDNKAILYVFMRTDLPDHTPGKALAQCNHAGTDFALKAGNLLEDIGLQSDLANAIRAWGEESGIGGTFGTCIVLGCTYSELQALERVNDEYALLSGIVIDPTYPIRNGHEVITAEVMTCGWAFLPRDRSGLYAGFKLY